MELRDWQRRRLAELRGKGFPRSRWRDEVTLVAYSFPSDPDGDAFDWIEASVLHTWSLLGSLRTVIVVHREFPKAAAFAAAYPGEVELQVEPSLVPGRIDTMSADCISGLHRRFSTPYCLIVQDDGFPLRGNLGDFLGRADYWGAPIISDGWRRKVAYALGFGSYNGGFSLRSRRLCEFAARRWRTVFSRFVRLCGSRCPYWGEDFFYTTWLRFLPSTWFRFRFPSERDAFAFACDALGGHVTIPAGARPFGAHGRHTFRCRDFLSEAEAPVPDAGL